MTSFEESFCIDARRTCCCFNGVGVGDDGRLKRVKLGHLCPPKQTWVWYVS